MSELTNQITSEEKLTQPEVATGVSNSGLKVTEPQLEDDEETVALANNPKFLEILERSRARYKAEGGISLEEMRRRLGLDGELAGDRPVMEGHSLPEGHSA